MIPLRDSIPPERLPFVNWALIAVNIAVHWHCSGLDGTAAEAFVSRWGAIPALFSPAAVGWGDAGRALPRLATCVFLHAGAAHLIGNMWALFIFGENIEGRLGHFSYLLFYLFCGAVASAAHILMRRDSAVPLIGASGAVAGVAGAYLAAFPRARILTLIWLLITFRLIWIPAFVFIAAWFAIDLANGMIATLAGTGAALWAHAGGFAAGYAALRIAKRRRPDDWLAERPL